LLLLCCSLIGLDVFAAWVPRGGHVSSTAAVSKKALEARLTLHWTACCGW